MSAIIDFFSKLGHRKNDVVEFKETMYSCVVNDKMSWHKSKDDMLRFIEEYSKQNVIYSLSMFRNDLYNLIK